MRTTRREHGRSALEIAEEAVYLLRLNASTALPAYYIGSLPFVFGLLWFWADMSHNPFATDHLPGGSLGLALLFLWMKFWQAVYAAALRARASAVAPPPWTFKRAIRMLLVQSAIQSSSVLFLPVSIIALLLPFGWVYAFYQNVTALGDGESVEIRKLIRRAYRQAMLWPGQNHMMLLILAGCACVVFINANSVCMMLPRLLKMLLGIESVYSQSLGAMLNTTFLAAMWGVTYLCVDPVIKAAYVLRCFYGESIDSGEDLKAELKQYATAPLRAAAIVIILIAGLAANSLQARADISSTNAAESVSETVAPKPAVTTAPNAVSASQLDSAINEIIHEPKYTWRMPRQAAPKEESTRGPIGRFIDRIWDWITDKAKASGRLLGKIITWLWNLISKWFTPRRSYSGKGGTGWIYGLYLLYWVLAAVVVCALVYLIYYVFRHNYRRERIVSSEALPSVPDLADENVGAEQLPEDGWLTLGRELLGRGELRLAMRAFYFASLTHLAARNLITIAKFKSNRDYERELSRRGHSLPNVLSLFGENVLVFDRSWYGMHDVNPPLVNQFLTNVEKMKAS